MCYIDDRLWIILIQDRGCPIDGSRCLKGHRHACSKASRTNESALQYKDVNIFVTVLFELYQAKNQYFEISLERKMDGICTVMGWIVDKRKRDVTAVSNVSPGTVTDLDLCNEITSWKTKQ